MRGKNVAIENSFYLQFQNTGVTDYTINLFNSGAEGVFAETIFRTGYLWESNGIFTTNMKYSIFIVNTTITILDTLSNVISSVNMLAGQTLAQYLVAANPLVDINGNVGAIDVIEDTNDISGQTYDIRITNLPTVSSITFTPDSANVAISTIQTYVLANPFVTCKSTVDINEIQASETGNSYHIMGLDIYSTDSTQLAQSISYGRKDSNGNRVRQTVAPVVDPYQENSASLHAVQVEGLIIDTEAQFNYTMKAGKTSRITFNYVKASLGAFREFNQAFMAEMSLKFLVERQYLNDLVRYRKILIQ